MKVKSEETCASSQPVEGVNQVTWSQTSMKAEGKSRDAEMERPAGGAHPIVLKTVKRVRTGRTESGRRRRTSRTTTSPRGRSKAACCPASRYSSRPFRIRCKTKTSQAAR